jgi:hypothetical protein
VTLTSLPLPPTPSLCTSKLLQYGVVGHLCHGISCSACCPCPIIKDCLHYTCYGIPQDAFLQLTLMNWKFGLLSIPCLNASTVWALGSLLHTRHLRHELSFIR